MPLTIQTRELPKIGGTIAYQVAFSSSFGLQVAASAWFELARGTRINSRIRAACNR